MFVFVMVGLVVFGLEWFLGVICWVVSVLWQVCDYFSGVISQLCEDIGFEFDDLWGYFGELQKLWGMILWVVLIKYLLDGDDFLFIGDFD